jgi:hypothetical protein
VLSQLTDDATMTPARPGTSFAFLVDMLILCLLRLAHAEPERAGARVDLGLGASSEGGLAARVGLTPELWWRHAAAGLRFSFDGDLEPEVLSGEIDFLRAEPCALLEVRPQLVAGLGIGGARATEHPGWSGSSADTTTRRVGTGSVIAGWVSTSRWFGAWLRADATTWPTLAITAELTLAPNVSLAPSSR